MHVSDKMNKMSISLKKESEGGGCTFYKRQSLVESTGLLFIDAVTLIDGEDDQADEVKVFEWIRRGPSG